MRIAPLVVALVIVMVAAACGGDDGGSDASPPQAPASATATDDGQMVVVAGDAFPDVVAAEIAPSGDGLWTVRATISSPYDSPERYANAWRVLDGDGNVLGVRELAHDHASEQPFTRSLAGVEIAADVPTVTIEGRDQANGWGGTTFELDVPTP